MHVWRGDVSPDEIRRMCEAYGTTNVIEEPRPDNYGGKEAMKARFGKSATPFAFDMFHAIRSSMIPALKADPAYDRIVRLRYDTIFDGVCPRELFNMTRAGDAIVVPSYYTPANGCNDQVAMGSQKAMGTYAQMIVWLHTTLHPDALI